jgi:hypothetical protein
MTTYFNYPTPEVQAELKSIAQVSNDIIISFFWASNLFLSKKFRFRGAHD